jgi:hypothetical protein
MRKETNTPAVRRPEGEACAFGIGQRLRFLGVQRTKPELRRSYGNSSESLQNGRQAKLLRGEMQQLTTKLQGVYRTRGGDSP